jgi:hypothetical protein
MSDCVIRTDVESHENMPKKIDDEIRQKENNGNFKNLLLLL